MNTTTPSLSLPAWDRCFDRCPRLHSWTKAPLWSVAAKTPDGDWQWTQIFETIDIDSEVVRNCLHDMHGHPNLAQNVFIKHGGGGKRKVRDSEQQPESRFLRRHGRHCSHMVGWDGTPPELQPAFEANHFMQAYHVICEEVAQGRFVLQDEHQKEWQPDVDQVKIYGINFVEKKHALLEPSVFNTHHRSSLSSRRLQRTKKEGGDTQETAGRAAKQAFKARSSLAINLLRRLASFCTITARRVAGMGEMVKL